jgi:hypothetical protein
MLLFGGFGKIDDLGHIRQIVARKRHHVGLEAVESLEIVLVSLGLQVEQAHVMAGPARGFGHKL